MERKSQSKCTQCRREGKKLFLKGEKCYSPKCPMIKRNFVPGVHGKTSGRRLTDYGERFRAKQQCKKYYGLRESMFKKYFKIAQQTPGNTGDNLLILLEKRLDNIVYASNIFPSRAMARQVVSHKLVYVNGKRVDVPSYKVKIGDVITFKFSDKMQKRLDEYSRTKKNAIENDHVYYDKDKKELKVLRDPDIGSIKENIDIKLIVEFYSK